MKTLLLPAYQPIVDLQTRRPCHFEALARIRTDSTGSGHVRLIELAERYGFIHQVDLAMAELVLRHISSHSHPVAINVSPQTLHHALPALLAVLARFAHYQHAQRLIVEITERQPVRDLQQLQRFIGTVRELGARVALDDFGNGCFTESMVRALRPDFLKVDGVVLERAIACHDASELLQAKRMVDAFGGQLIIEYVDSEEKAEVARDIGIRYGQGHLFGMPMWAFPGDTNIGWSADRPLALPSEGRTGGRIQGFQLVGQS